MTVSIRSTNAKQSLAAVYLFYSYSTADHAKLRATHRKSKVCNRDEISILANGHTRKLADSYYFVSIENIKLLNKSY